MKLTYACTDLIGATEFPSDPSDYVNVSGNAGCYNDTDLPKTISKDN